MIGTSTSRVACAATVHPASNVPDAVPDAQSRPATVCACDDALVTRNRSRSFPLPLTTCEPVTDSGGVAVPVADTSATALQRLGGSVRTGVELRQVFSPRIAALLQGGGVFGNVVQAGDRIGFNGFRVAASLEVSP